MSFFSQVWKARECTAKGELLSDRFAESTGRTLPLVLDEKWEREALSEMCVGERRSVAMSLAEVDDAFPMLELGPLDDEGGDKGGDRDDDHGRVLTLDIRLTELSKPPKVEQFHPGLRFEL